LHVSGWTYKTDQLFFGSDNSGLTNAQLGMIQFDDFRPGASISSAGLVTPRIGDIDQNGFVNVADVSILMFALSGSQIPGTGGQTYQQHYFSGASDPVDDLAFILDVNGDGVVNNKDIQAEINLIANGASPGGAMIAAVPEPSGIVLFAVGGLIFWGQRFRGVQKRRKLTN
jgi:hypothetical protein